MWFPRVVHKTVIDLRWYLRKHKYLRKGNRSLILVVGIQNNDLKFGITVENQKGERMSYFLTKSLAICSGDY